ncbi:MAG: zinc ribbon domain-containing protein [Chloroflexi bacterium]|nr:zinc ribbon domain-containing protein [Chloroflexota bacterium]
MTDYLLLTLMVIALFGAVAPFVLAPFRRRVLVDDELERRRSVLLARREAIINALRELELDYAVGKLPEEDYQRQREALRREGAAVLKALDELEQQAQSRPRAVNPDVDARIEALLEQRRGKRPHVGDTTPQSQKADATEAEPMDELIEHLLHQRRQNKEGRFVGFCPHCGAPVMEHDRFCGRCGQPLTPLGAPRSKASSRRKKRRSKSKR